MLRTIIQYIYYALFAVTPFLMYSKTSELFEFNKMMYIYGTTVVVSGLWFLMNLEKKRIDLPKHWFVILLLVFIVALTASTIYSIDVHTSLYGYYGRFNGGLLSIISYSALFLVFIAVSDRRHVLRCLRISVVTAFLVVLWGIPGRYGSDLSCLVFTGKITNACWTAQFKPAERMFSTLGQPNWLGAYLAVNLFFGTYFLSIRDRYKNRSTLIVTVITVVIFTGILFTRSRSALLATGISSIIMGLSYLLIYRKELKRRFVPLMALTLVMVVPVIVFQTGITRIDSVLSLSLEAGNKQHINESRMNSQEELSSHEESLADSSKSPDGERIVITDSFTIRQIVWEGAVELARQYPVLGTGPETFAYAYYSVRPLAHNMTSEWDFLYNKAHNEFLNYLATTGYVGFVIYLGLVASVIVLLQRLALQKKASKKEQLFYANLIAAYLTIQITNFFGFSISMIQILFYLIPAFAIIYQWQDTPRFYTRSIPKSSLFQKGSQAAILLMMILGIIFVLRYYIADVSYASAEVHARAGNYQTAYDKYGTALQMRSEHVYQDKLSHTLSQLAFIASYQEQDELTGQLTRLSDSYNAESIAASPMNVLYWKTTSKNKYVQYQIGLDPKRLVEAVDALDVAKQLSPTDPRIPYSKALFLSLLADANEDPEYQKESLEQAKESVQLKPDYKEAVLLHAELLRKYEDESAAREVLQSYVDEFGYDEQIVEMLDEE
ncbi:MAG: O-antigen ligase family protein [Patescibacteria group bacterium]